MDATATLALDDVLKQASEAIASFLGPPSPHEKQHSTKGPSLFKPAKSLHHGEISAASREIGNAVRLQAEQRQMTLEEVLSSAWIQKVTFDPRGHLYLSLNRPLMFARCIREVTGFGASYGAGQTPGAAAESVAIMDHCLDVQFTLKDESMRLQGAAPLDQWLSLGLNEGRTTLMSGLLSCLLKSTGCSVKCFNKHLSEPSPDDPVFPVWHLFQTFLGGAPAVAAVKEFTVEQFLASLSACPYLVRSDVAADLQGMAIDVKKFLQDTGLSGKGGYDKNLDKTVVTDKFGSLTPAGLVAYEASKATIGGGSHLTIHIVQQRNSFTVQQAMAVANVFSKEKAVSCNQHLLLTSKVECFTNGKPVKTCTLAELMRTRLQQMTEVYIIKYGERAKDPQFQGIALRMAEAVVKFELLSTDPKSTVKIELPDATASGMETDLRFSGAFVLYNYARLATLFINHRRVCERGMYPPLPDVTEVDFSLLKEEEEWELLFHYVLQYPSVIREAAELKKTGIGIHLEVGLKKLCLFLTKLSHAFSSYYSRVKILVAPEPHLLPLIHARLHLMAAIKQVMKNALALLAIEPLDQL